MLFQYTQLSEIKPCLNSQLSAHIYLDKKKQINKMATKITVNLANLTHSIYYKVNLTAIIHYSVTIMRTVSVYHFS